MPKKIVIIGGGVSGLSAANYLVRGVAEVTVLEAKSQFGGRVHTVMPDGHIVELGAEFFHGQSQAIIDLLKAAELSTHPVNEDYQLHQQGVLKHLKFLPKIDRIIEGIDIHRPDCTFLDYAQQLAPDDRALALNYVQGFHAAHPELASAQALRRGDFATQQLEIPQQSRINQGYGALVSFLEQEVRAHGGKMALNAPVQSIEWQPGHVEVAYAHSQIIKADAAVITLPLGVLKSGAVGFHPPLTAKTEAIEGLHFGNVVKIIFEFKKRWWPDFGFILDFDHALPTWWTDPRSPTLTAWAGGPKADLLLDYPPKKLEDLGLEILHRFFPKHAEKIRAEFVSSHTFDWAGDPYTGGAYSYLPVNGLDLPKLLGAPLADTLFFAGEATVRDAVTGTVVSAFDTGLRAAREVQAALAERQMKLLSH